MEKRGAQREKIIELLEHHGGVTEAAAVSYTHLTLPTIYSV